MNNVEELLRDALAAEAEQYQPSPDLWSRIAEARPARRRRFVLPGLALAATACVAVAVVALLPDDDERVVTVPPLTTIPTVPPVPATVTCDDIHFTPNTEDMASKITYSSIDLDPDKQQNGCADASALVRKVSAEHNFFSGPREFTVDGWRCTVVTEEVELAVGHYTCTSGSRRITWDKT